MTDSIGARASCPPDAAETAALLFDAAGTAALRKMTVRYWPQHDAGAQAWTGTWRVTTTGSQRVTV